MLVYIISGYLEIVFSSKIIIVKVELEYMDKWRWCDEGEEEMCSKCSMFKPVCPYLFNSRSYLFVVLFICLFIFFVASLCLRENLVLLMVRVTIVRWEIFFSSSWLKFVFYEFLVIRCVSVEFFQSLDFA